MMGNAGRCRGPGDPPPWRAALELAIYIGVAAYLIATAAEMMGYL